MIITNDEYENVVDVLTWGELMEKFGYKNHSSVKEIVDKGFSTREKKFPKNLKIEKIERRIIDD